MENKRKLERFTLNVPALLLLHDTDGGEQKYETWTRNISAEGAYFRLMAEQIPVGAEVAVELSLTFERLTELLGATDRVTARVDGRIVRGDPDGVAVTFDQPFRFFPDGEGESPGTFKVQPA